MGDLSHLSNVKFGILSKAKFSLNPMMIDISIRMSMCVCVFECRALQLNPAQAAAIHLNG